MDFDYIHIDQEDYASLYNIWKKDNYLLNLLSSEFDASMGLNFVCVKTNKKGCTQAYLFTIFDKKLWMLAKIKYGI